MKPIILFRSSIDTEDELEIARKYFDVTDSRTECKNRLVIGRYSVLPFYKELEKDLENNNSRLINSYHQHKYIANFDYYKDVKDFTPETWFELTRIPEGGPYIVKGKTNSKKHKWNTLMFAKDRIQAIRIATELMDDPLIEQQGIIVRKYIPLEFLEEGINGQPFVNEHRIFFYKETMLATGFYWAQTEITREIEIEGLLLAQEIAKIVSRNVDFFVLDIAKTAEGKWILIEINDAQMSGLSDCNPELLYSNLSQAIR